MNIIDRHPIYSSLRQKLITQVTIWQNHLEDETTQRNISLYILDKNQMKLRKLSMFC